jgi:hypothetical protein
VTHQISTSAFFRRLSESLTRSTKAVTKLHLLRLTRVACAEHPDRATLVSRFGLAGIVEDLGQRDDAVLVRELAKEIYPTLLFGTEPPVVPKVGLAEKVVCTSAGEGSGDGCGTTGTALGMSGIPKRILSSMKRSSSEVIVGDLKDKEGSKSKGGRNGITEVVSVAVTPVREERPKHKRKISRGQLR